jgi:nucleoside-diphosphate-sugar epimerase
LRTRDAYAGGVIEIVVWAVPRPVSPATHGFKYRLVFIWDGVRVVGYDNERGKGDHRHIGAGEKAYKFRDVPTLLADLMRDVEASI